MERGAVKSLLQALVKQLTQHGAKQLRGDRRIQHMWTFNKHSPNFVPPSVSQAPSETKRNHGFPFLLFRDKDSASLGMSSHGKKICSNLLKSPAWPDSLPCWQGGKPVRKTFSLRRWAVPSFAFAGCSPTTGKHQLGDFRINSHNTSTVATARSGSSPAQDKPQEGFPLILKEH